MPVLAILCGSFAASLSAPDPSVVRLPSGVRPLAYDVRLTVRPDQPEFDGVVSIDIALEGAQSSIRLNALDLTVTRAEAKTDGKTATARFALGDQESLELSFARPLPAGDARLTIHFRGRARDDANIGIYRRRSPSGGWFVYTTFTAIEARRAFPCFDQPDFKTPWRFALTVPSSDVVLSNAPSVSETASPGGMKTAVFAPTRPLPSDVVAFTVGPFALVDGGSAGRNAVQTRIVVPRGREADALPAAELSRLAVPRLESYTDIPYPFQKLDHIALLEGAFGGVENAALIQYRANLLLVPPGAFSADRRARLEGLITHELAHQWFGNLVTMAKWKDVWLSEGFATWMGNKIADESLPSEERGLRMAAAREEAKQADAFPSARPVRLELQTREEMKQVYHRIVYNKGGAVLAMLEGWLGEQALKQAVRRYLAGGSDRAVTTDDLLAAVSAAAGRDIAPVAHSFLDQPGIPQIEAELRCDPAHPRLVLRQAAYRMAGDGERSGLWNVPLCAVTPAGTDCTLVSGASQEMAFRSASCPDWFYPNAGGWGYFRLKLSHGLLDKLTSSAQLSPTERVAVVGDIDAMVKANQLPAGDALRYLSRWGGDSAADLALSSTTAFIELLVPPRLRGRYADYIAQAFGSKPNPREPAEPAHLDIMRRYHAASLTEVLDRR